MSVVALAKTFPGSPPLEVLHPTTFDVHEGEYVSVTGPSGSGKTTLLSLLGLLDSATSGTYLLDGVDAAATSDRDRSALRSRKIGFVFQAFHLLGQRTVLENIELGLVYQGVRRRVRRMAAVSLAHEIGIGHRLDSPCARLSGGEKQRVAIARALIHEPALILCDEPTGNLDTVTAGHVLELFDVLHTRGQTIMLVTHDAATARRASRHLTVSDGSVSEQSATTLAASVSRTGAADGELADASDAESRPAVPGDTDG